MRTIEITRPDDFHIHLRQGAMLGLTVPHCAAHFARAIVMPNTLPPVDSADKLKQYRDEILSISGGTFAPLMTFKLLKSMKPGEIGRMKDAGAVAGKLYPAGATTNSEDGIQGWLDIEDLLKEMEELGLVLSIHGEDPSVYSMDREKAYIPEILVICEKFPGLKVVFEHLSSREGVDAVLSGPENLSGTVTVHHLLMTLDDVIGVALNPHNFCKPVLKSPSDRDAIQKAVLSGNRKIFFGSDSAPHPLEKKENGTGSAGSYSSPVALAALAEFFDDRNSLDKLENFVSVYGADFYGLPRNKGKIRLSDVGWVVPEIYGKVKPLFAGKKMKWKVTGVQ